MRNFTLGVVVAVLICAAHCRTLTAATQQPQGFILRGILDDATSDGSGYFKIGETLVLAIPNVKNSALVPGLKTLVGKNVVITVLPDDHAPRPR
jgi:hypothetical protein